MGKLKLQMQLSVDGYVAGPNGEMDFMVWNWGDDIKNFVSNLTDSVDRIVMGRKLAQGFIPYWQDVASKPDDPQFEFGKKMVSIPKIVFTKTLDSSGSEVAGWKNTSVSKQSLTDKINELKKADGKDIVAYGGSNFASELIGKNLIDEYYLFINPAARGTGMTIFKDHFKLALVDAKKFDCGIVLLNYKPLN